MKKLWLISLSSIFLIMHPKNRLSSINIKNDSLLVAHEGYLIYPMEKNGEQNIIDTILQPYDIIFDVGAYVGEWTSRVIDKLQNNVTIFAFEPMEDAYKQFIENVQHKNLSIFKIALSNEQGNKDFFIYHHNPKFSSLYDRININEKYDTIPEKITVSCSTIDDFCSQKNIRHIDYLKIDAEGSDFMVLLGAKKKLSQEKIGIIQFEYAASYKYAKATLHKAFSFLTKFNFVIFRIAPAGLIYINSWYPELENYTYSNYLAVQSKLCSGYSLMRNL